MAQTRAGLQGPHRAHIGPHMGPIGPQGPQTGAGAPHGPYRGPRAARRHGGHPQRHGDSPRGMGSPPGAPGTFLEKVTFGLQASPHQTWKKPLKTGSPASGTHLNRSGLLFCSRRPPKILPEPSRRPFWAPGLGFLAVGLFGCRSLPDVGTFLDVRGPTLTLGVYPDIGGLP